MRFLIVRQIKTHAGIKTQPVRGLGCDQLVLCGPSATHVIDNARSLGLYGVTALELDANDRPITAKETN